ncbi:hypothetical protein M885DRAFT_566143 [Pelagophyceae sp. CCMP2097]|nr:hypothetical protein M885DRAFT_566143 [Pelagophyceae sp. CCMP2097]
MGRPSAGVSAEKSAEKKKQAAKKDVVHPNSKTVTKLFRQVAAAVCEWRALEDEGGAALASIASFRARVPLLNRAAEVPAMLGALAGDAAALVPQLLVKHLAEIDRLAAHVDTVTRRGLDRAVDEMHDAVETALQVVQRPAFWDPSVPEGSSPLSPCEMVTWMRQLATMFSDELWRKQVLLDDLRAPHLGSPADDDAKRAARAAAAARLWADASEESFVDVAFVEQMLATCEAM